MNCPLDCGFDGELSIRSSSGFTVFVCPECLGVAFDGAALSEPRRSFDLARHVEAVRNKTSLDPATGTKNRRFFFHRLGVELLEAEHKHFVSVAAFKFDGDLADLRAAAATLLSQIRIGDNFARVESHVFGLILPHADAFRAEQIVRRIAPQTHCAVLLAGVGQSAEEIWCELLVKVSKK